MQVVRVLVGVLLLIVGIPALLAGAVLGADLTLNLRAELRAGWTAPVTVALLTGGVLLVASALLLLLRPVRPREVVFVVEPDQVPVLAGRLGVTSLSGLGLARDGGDRAVAPARQLVSVGAPLNRPRPALGPVPARRHATGPVPAYRPATLADLLEWTGESGPGGSGGAHRDGEGRRGGAADARRGRRGARCAAPLRPSEVDLSLVWPPTTAPKTAPPTPPSAPEPALSVESVPPGEPALSVESVPPGEPALSAGPMPSGEQLATSDSAVRRESPRSRLRPAVPGDPAQ